QVIIKQIPEALLSPGALMRLEYETMLLARVQSSHVAPVLFTGRERNCFWLISQYVPGASLSRRLAQGRLELTEALAVARSLLKALADLHRNQILHRSVRAANLIVDEGQPITPATLVD